MSEDIYSAIEYLHIQKTAIRLHQKYSNDPNVDENDTIVIEGEYLNFYTPLDIYPHCVRGTLIGPYTIFFGIFLYIIVPIVSIVFGLVNSIYDSISKKCKHV